MTVAFVALGSNLGDRLDNLRRAVRELGLTGISVRKVSSVYESEAVGPPQPDYLNAVCEIETGIAARDLLVMLKLIEAAMGRQPAERWRPRVIDLDILLFGDEAIDEPDLEVPHPELTNRAFVVVPLLEIARELTLPGGERLSSFELSESRRPKLAYADDALLSSDDKARS